jgi:hypothetical protein
MMITAIVAAVLIQARPVRIPDEPTCAKCAITMRVISTLESPADAVADRPWSISIDNDGRYWMLLEQETPAVYEPSGKFLRSVGRKGQGPGEYQMPQHVLFAGDSIAIVDPSNSRITILDRSLAVRRSIVTSFQIINPIVMAWPTIVGAGMAGRLDPNSAPFHRVTLSGVDARDRPFGLPTPFTEPAQSFGNAHWFTPSAGGRVWAARREGYNLSEWNADGTLARALERRPSWFPSKTPSRLGNPTTPPDAVIAGIERDPDGLLWVFLHSPAPTWKEGWPVMRPGQREVSGRSIQYEKIYRTTIEVIDPRAGRVVARQEFDRYLMNSLPGHRGAFFSRGIDDAAKTTVVEFALTGR